MRKISLIICAFMLLLPALASAYTLQVKVAGGKTAVNTVTVNGLTTAGSGTYYTYPANVGTVTPSFAGTVASATLDGAVYNFAAPTAISKPAGYTSTLIVTFASASKYTVTATQPANGAIYVQQTLPSRSSNVAGALSEIGGSATVVISVYPNSGYAVSAITSSTGVLAGTAPVYTAVAGQAVTYTLTSGELQANPTITATLAAVTQTGVTASMSVNPGAVMLATVSNFKGYASSNAIAPTFAFDIYSSPAGKGAAHPAITATGSTATFTADTVGTWIASVQVNGNSNVAQAYFTVSNTRQNDVYFCEGCHNGRNSDVTGAYNGSGHFSNNFGPTCQTCHFSNFAGGVDPALKHTGVILNPGTVQGTITIYNACIGCHNGNYSRQFGEVTHFTNATSATFHNISAAFVGYKGKGINACNNCHFTIDPHGVGDSTPGMATFQQNMPVLDAWAGSGHGDKQGAAWIPGSSHDWRNSGSNTVNFSTTIPASDCVRCHTADGFANFFGSKFNKIDSVGVADGQRYNSPLACSACHADDPSSLNTTSARRATAVKPYVFKNLSSYAYSIGVQTFYNISTNKNAAKAVIPTYKARIVANFPDVGDSNICISCHSARLSGAALVAAYNAGMPMNNSGFNNSHYMAAAGVMYVKAGFTSFTSASAPVKAFANTGTSLVPIWGAGTATSFAKTLTVDNQSTPDGILKGVTSTHRKLGTTLIKGDHGITAGNLDSGGPCVTCHMAATNTTARDGAGHSLLIGEDGSTQAYTTVCINCHKAEGNAAGTNYAIAADGSDFATKFLEPNASAYQATIKLALYHLLKNYNISYNSASYPYFYDENLAAGKSVADWTRGGTLTPAMALKLEGACFNINLLSREPAAYVHARTYARRLLYDTIDFLDDGIMNDSAATTATSATSFTSVGAPNGSTSTVDVTGLFVVGDVDFAYAIDDLDSSDTPYLVANGVYKAGAGKNALTKFGFTGAVINSEPMLYIKAWDRTSGRWSKTSGFAPDRP